MTTDQRLGLNDCVLFLSLVYSAYDLTSEWEHFGLCQRPIHWWLISSYVAVVGFRLTHLAGGCLAEGGNGDEFLLDLRQKNGLPKALMMFTWFFCLPSFLLMTFVGTSWLYNVVHYSPACVPSPFHLWFAGFWLILCYASVLVYGALGVAAWIVERRIRAAERDIQEIAGSSDAADRWGEVGQLAGYRSFSALPDAGLTPAQIKVLPGLAVVADSSCGLPETHAETGAGCEERCLVCCSGEDCPICIMTLQQGDSVRRLATCGHTFHRSCIDLWLLRRADCPLCKRSVVDDGGPAGDIRV